MADSMSKAEQSQKTQRVLLDVARELFTEHGYAHTSTEEVVRRAGVTRGALYYHYRDKVALFEAVFDELRAAYMQAISERVEAAEGDLWQRLVVTGCQAFIENVADPSVRRIVYIDGPAVLDWPAEQKSAPGLIFLRNVFEQLMSEGFIEKRPLEPLVRLLWAGLFEVGAYIAQADDRAAAQKEMTDALMYVLNGLRLQSEPLPRLAKPAKPAEPEC
jgi:AcrR family transcriptional regulator